MGAIVDTAVWVDYFRGQLPEPQRSFFRNLIDNELAYITDIIFYELVIGTRTNAEMLQIKDFTSVLSCLSIAPDEFEQFAKFGLSLRKQGLLGTFTDVSIAYLAQKHQLRVLSSDKYFRQLARSGIIMVL